MLRARIPKRGGGIPDESVATAASARRRGRSQTGKRENLRLFSVVCGAMGARRITCVAAFRRVRPLRAGTDLRGAAANHLGGEARARQPFWLDQRRSDGRLQRGLSGAGL